jgi:hypothetical protein
MTTRAELEAALAKAEADWRRASDELDGAQEVRAKANADWDQQVAERRTEDRRKTVTIWDKFAERRKAVADRRNAHTARDQANAAWDQAHAARSQARAAWEQARAALDELNRKP